MDEVEVEGVEAEAVHGGIEGTQGVVVAAVGVPDLGGQKDFVPGDAAGADGAAHSLLVAVKGGGVYEAVPGVNGHPGEFLGLGRFNFVCPITNLWYFYAVVELHGCASLNC